MPSRPTLRHLSIAAEREVSLRGSAFSQADDVSCKLTYMSVDGNTRQTSLTPAACARFDPTGSRSITRVKQSLIINVVRWTCQFQLPELSQPPTNFHAICHPRDDDYCFLTMNERLLFSLNQTL